MFLRTDAHQFIKKLPIKGVFLLPLYVETEVYHIAVLHHIVLAFHANLTFFAGSSYTAVGHEVIVVDDFGADKAAFKVRVNLASGLRCRGALGNRPGTAFIRASGQEGLQA